MQRKARWGILSTAHINRRLIPEIHASSRGELLAVASRSPDQAQAYASQWEIPRSYGSYLELLADPDIDLVYISLPNDLHAQWTIRALEAGKHVLCEKPLCLTLEELMRIRNACERTGKVAMEAFMYVHHPQMETFRKVLAENTIGAVVAMHSEFAATFSRDAGNYRLDPRRGGGALWDVGVYPVSFFLGFDDSEVELVTGKAHIVNGIDLSFWGRMDFASGVSGQFFASFESEYSTRTAILGTHGRLDITHPFNATDDCQAWLTRAGATEALPLPKASLYACEIEQMHDVLFEQAQPLFSLNESQRVLGHILDLRASAGL